MTHSPELSAVSVPREATIGVPQLIAYYLSNLVGAGVFVIPALAQDAAGTWVLVAWFLMILGAIPTAWVMGRISIDHPDDNGILSFIGKAISPHLSAVVSRLFVFIMVVGNPIMGIISARYAMAAFGLNSTMLYPLAIAFMILSIAFNLTGLRNSARLQTVLVAVAMVTLIVLALMSVGSADTYVLEPTSLQKDGFLVAIAICFFAFLGWENVATIAPDVKSPERTFPIALLISVPLVGGVYLLVALALLLTSQSDGLNGNFAVMDHLVAAYANPHLSFGVNILALAVVVLSTNAWVLSAARLLSSGARDLHLPRFLSPGTGGIDLHTMGTLAVCYTVVIGLMYMFDGGEEAIVPFVSAGFLIIYLVTFGGAIRHYRYTSTAKFAIAALIMMTLFAASVWVNSLLIVALLAGLVGYDKLRASRRLLTQ